VSAAAVMLDISKTFAPYDESDLHALEQVSRAISRSVEVGALHQPVKVIVAAFGNDGLSPALPCGPALTFKQTLVQAQDQSAAEKATSKIEEFKSWLLTCPALVRVHSATAESYTDIHGALLFAAKATADASGRKLIVMYSDMFEDLPPNQKPAAYELGGADVVMLWRPGLDDRESPGQVYERVKDWKSKLTTAGASRVCDASIKSVTSEDILSCLSK
jgi:hypothetical protein